MTVAGLLIVLSTAWFAFGYVGYPIALWLLRSLAPRRSAATPAASSQPSVSVIVAVHNGEHELTRKLEDTLAQAYTGRLEVIVASDGSTDHTDAIAESFALRGVRLVSRTERRGKEAAQAAAIGEAKGDVLVLTDVSALLEPGAIEAIVRPFADPTIGGVSSEDVVDQGGGEGLYVRYEMALRRLESEAATLVGLSGSFFAIRRELATPWPPHLASDFRCALEAARRGLRTVSAADARARFGTARAPGAEWQRKVRTVRRGLAVLFAYRELLHPRHGRVALALWGHKVARFTSPFALLVMLGASAAAAPASALAGLLLIAQLAFYALGAAALDGARARPLTPGAHRGVLPARARLGAGGVGLPRERPTRGDLEPNDAMSALRIGRLPPAGEYIGPSVLRRVLSDPNPARTLTRGLQDILGRVAITFHGSGREAMRVAFAHLAAKRGRYEIVIPAYTCFSVAASAVAAGLRVRLVDVDPRRQDRPGFARPSAPRSGCGCSGV